MKSRANSEPNVAGSLNKNEDFNSRNRGLEGVEHRDWGK